MRTGSIARYNRTMSEKVFPIDGSDPGDVKYEPVSALKQGPDAPAAAFNAELQALLDKTPSLPIDPESQKIEEVRSGLLEYQRLHRTASQPTHTLLDDRKKIVDVVLPRAEEVKDKGVPVSTRRLPQQFYDEARSVLDAHIEGDKKREAEVMDFFSRGRKPLQDFFDTKGIRLINAQDGWRKIVDKLIERDLIGDFGNGIYGTAALRGGSDAIENEPSKIENPQTWVVPEDFKKEFKAIQTNNKDLRARTGLNLFEHFALDAARTKEQLIEKLQNTKGTGTFTDEQYQSLLSKLISQESEVVSAVKEKINPEELFKPAPPPVVTQEEVPPPPIVQESVPVSEAFIEGVRIGAENWGAQHLEDEQGNKLPLTAENYIKSVGGILNQEIIHNVDAALSALVERGIATRTPEGYEVRKVSRIAKKESDTEKVSEIPALLISLLNDLADHSDRPAGFKALTFSLKEPGVTREQATMLLESSAVLDIETKKKLIGVLHGVVTQSRETQMPEPPPVVEQQEVIPPPPIIAQEVVPPPPVVEPESNLPDTVFPIPVKDPAVHVKSLNERMSEAAVNAKGVEMSQAAVEKFSTTRHEEPIGPITKQESKKIEGELDEKMRNTLKVFAKEESLRKQKLYADKKAYEKLLSDLGVSGRQRPVVDSDLTQNYLNAKKEYVDASRTLRNFIAHRDIRVEEVSSRAHESSVVERVIERRIDLGVMKQVETERELLGKLVRDAIPQKEKGIITKSFEQWARLPLGARIGISATFFSLASGGVGSFAAAAVLRATRGLAGVGGAKLAGTAFDGIKRKRVEEQKKKALEAYATINAVGDDMKDADLDEYYDEAENQEKLDRVAKFAIMAAAGGITAAGTGATMNAIHDSVVTTGIKINADTHTGAKTSAPEAGTSKPILTPETKSKNWLHKLTKNYDSVEVKLSNKGFIDTVVQLKDSLKGHEVPPAVEKLLSQSPEKVAMDLGLYKPEQVAESAFGFQKEQLTLNVNGEITLMHTDGSTDVLLDAEGKIHHFDEFKGNKMFDADKKTTSSMPTDVVEVPVAPKAAEVIPQTPKPVVETIPEVSNVEIKSSISKFEVAADAAVVGTSVIENNGKIEAVVSQGVEIATPSPDFKTIDDMFLGKMPLKMQYQFSEDASIRKEYAKFFTRTLALLDDSVRKNLFDYHLPVQYKGGQINIFQKGSDITILLNGEKIGSTKLIDGNFGFQYETGLGKPLFGVKSEYEVALEEAKKVIVKNSSKFLKTSK